LLEDLAQRQTQFYREIEVVWLTARGCSAWSRPQIKRGVTDPNLRSPRSRRPSLYSDQLVARCFCFAILSRRSALNVGRIYSILKETERTQYQPAGDPSNNAMRNPAP
jgi:hypothetical protein